MRLDGQPTSWSEATGSGVITPGKGGNDIAVHASALPQDGIVPPQGELLSFAVEMGPDRNKRAHSIARPRASSGSVEGHQPARSSSSLITGALVILTASAALFYASMRHDGTQPLAEPVPAMAAEHAAAIPHAHRTDLVAASRFARPPSASCDGRTRCTEMNSCAEAKFFQEHCPGAEMDGDSDGIPCESQWCAPAQASVQPGL